MKFHENTSWGAELFDADGRTDGHDEVNSRLSQFLWTRIKTQSFTKCSSFHKSLCVPQATSTYESLWTWSHAAGSSAVHIGTGLYGQFLLFGRSNEGDWAQGHWNWPLIKRPGVTQLFKILPCFLPWRWRQPIFPETSVTFYHTTRRHVYDSTCLPTALFCFTLVLIILCCGYKSVVAALTD